MSNEAYTEGMNAQLEGKEFWENPHTSGNSRYLDGAAWFAGWCYSKKTAIPTAVMMTREQLRELHGELNTAKKWQD